VDASLFFPEAHMKTALGIIFLLVLCADASAQNQLGNPTTRTLQQLAELTGTETYALVSTSVAISGNTLVIGAPSANSPNGCFECGAAYVYTAVGGDWTNLSLTATLEQSSGQFEGGFGDSVAIGGDTIVVGGYDFAVESGAAYVYISPSGTTTENAELTTSGSASGVFNSVSIDGNAIVAGSNLSSVGSEKEVGSAYVYVEPEGGWINATQTALLVANNESMGCYFGNSVGISGNTVVVGAPRSDANGLVQRGRAYVFVAPAEGWSGTRGQTAELDPSDGTSRAYFGQSVSISGGNVIVGAPQQTIGSNGTQGAVYVYTRPSTGWPKTMTETAELTAVNGKAGSELGYSVALSGRTLLSGAADTHNHQGTAYVFSEPAGGWQTGAGGTPISASDGAASNGFGAAVGIGGGVLTVSAPGWPNGIGGDGAVYIFGQVQ
jgi:archaellin